MSETQGAAAPKKPKTEYIDVELSDGRNVKFPVKRQVQKDVIFVDGKPAVRIDFANGDTITCLVPEHHLLYAAGHGYSQKLGDEFAGLKASDGSPASLEDKLQAVKDLHRRLESEKDWNEVRQGEGGAAGSSVVIRALMEFMNKTEEQVQQFLEKKMTKLACTRQALYASFRAEMANPDSQLGGIMRRLEQSKKTTISREALLADED